jgi:hypothetical protein
VAKFFYLICLQEQICYSQLKEECSPCSDPQYILRDRDEVDYRLGISKL